MLPKKLISAFPTSNWEPTLSVTSGEIIKATSGSGYNTSRAGAGPHGQKDEVMLPNKSGAEPHGRVDEVMPPNKPFSALPASNQEPTLSVALPTSNWEPTLSGADWLPRHRGRLDYF